MKKKRIAYFYECKNSHGYFKETTDKRALKRVEHWIDLLCLYKENNTPNGRPFIILKEQL